MEPQNVIIMALVCCKKISLNVSAVNFIQEFSANSVLKITVRTAIIFAFRITVVYLKNIVMIMESVWTVVQVSSASVIKATVDHCARTAALGSTRMGVNAILITAPAKLLPKTVPIMGAVNLHRAILSAIAHPAIQGNSVSSVQRDTDS